MLKANIINESFDNMLRNIINESKLTEDTINDEDELRSALTDAVSKLMDDRIINLKSYEIALQDAIEKVYPDYSWWEITSTNIFMDLFEKRDPWAVVDDIMSTLTIPSEEEEDQEYAPSLTSDDMNAGQWYESLKESKKLDEKIPKDLSKSMRRDFGNQKYYRTDSSRFNRDNTVGVNNVVDYENSTYQEVDADTIKQMKKNGEDLSNVYVVKNGEHIKLDADGHPTWKSADARGIRSNQSLNKTLSDADKIYIADEKFVKDTQPEKFAQRHQDQEERNNNMNLGAYRSNDDDEKRYRKYMYRNDHKSKKAIERAKQDYEDGDISRKEMERIIANNQPEIDTWSGRNYQEIRNRKSDAINYAANKSASAKVSEYKELKRSIPEAERAISRAKDDIEKFNTGQSTHSWSDYDYNKRSADRYRKEIEDLERKLEFAKKQLQSYESKLTSDAKDSELKALEDKLSQANDDLEAKTARLKALLRKNEALRRISKSKELNEAKDLSKVDGSMSNIIENNIDKINKCTSVSEVSSTIQNLFKENDIDTQASRRLIMNIGKQKSLIGALSVVYNSYLAGSGQGVIK